MLLVETLRRLWFLFLALFRSKPEPRTVLPLSSNGKTRVVVGKPELLSPPHQRDPAQRRRTGLTANTARLAGSHQIQNVPQGLPPHDGHPHFHRRFSAYSLILPDQPPPRPPRPRSISTSASEDEFGTPVTPNVRLPSVIVTPCTPSTKAGRTRNGLDELNSDENGDSSGSDANSCIGVGSVDSNPFLSDPSPPLQKEYILPPLGPGGLNSHHRARSLTGTGRGLRHQRLSPSEHLICSQPVTTLSPLPRFAKKTSMLTNPVKKCDSRLPIGNSSVAPTTSEPSFIRSRPCDSTSQAIADQRIRSYTTRTSERPTDQTPLQNVIPDAASASTRHSEDPKAASCRARPAVLACANAGVMSDRITASSNLTPSVQVVPYTEVFDLDTYFDYDSSLPSQSTLTSSLHASCSTINSNESKNPFLTPTTPSANCSSSAILVSPPTPLCRISNVSDTTASSTSLYTYSLSNTSTDMDGSTSVSASPHLGPIQIADSGKKTKPTFNHEVKRYRDHYRPSAYSRSPAFVIESPTTSRKFTRKRESDGLSVSARANKENERVGPTTPVSTSTRLSNTKIVELISPLTPGCLLRGTTTISARQNCTLDSSTTTAASISPTGKNIATQHRLGSVAISQRRRM